MRRKITPVAGSVKVYLLLSILFLFLLSVSASSQSQQFPNGTIITVAGIGSGGYNGDNIQATTAELNRPYKAAIDSTGNIYIADSGNHRIRKVLTNGTIITVAGNGNPCPDQTLACNEGAVATNAMLRDPEGVAVDTAGNIFIIDSIKGRIRKVDAATNKITTIAGTGYRGYSGDGGPATSAQLDDASDIAVDASGNIYIAEYSSGSGVIRKLTPNGQGNYTISTVAGNNTECADQTSKINPCGDNGPATSAQVGPRAVAVDSSGNIYIADGTNRVRKVDASTGKITTIAGTGDIYNTAQGDNGSATLARVDDPADVELDAYGNVYVIDQNIIRKIDKDTGTIVTVAGKAQFGLSNDNISATLADLHSPFGIKFDLQGNLYIVQLGDGRVRKVTNIGQPAPPIQPPQPTPTPNATASPTPTQSTLITLISPKTLQTTGDITFGCIVSGANFTEVSLYTNTSGVWKKEETKPFRLATVQDFQLTDLKSGSYIWNCEAKTASGNLSQSPQNQSFEVKLNVQGSQTPQPTVVCDQLKDCTDWKPDKCPATKTQTRSCKNSEQCNYPETWFCNYTGSIGNNSELNVTGPVQGGKSSEGLLGLDTTSWIIIVVVIVVAVAVLLILIKRRTVPLYEEQPEPTEPEYQEDEENRNF